MDHVGQEHDDNWTISIKCVLCAEKTRRETLNSDVSLSEPSFWESSCTIQYHTIPIWYIQEYMQKLRNRACMCKLVLKHQRIVNKIRFLNQQSRSGLYLQNETVTQILPLTFLQQNHPFRSLWWSAGEQMKCLPLFMALLQQSSDLSLMANCTLRVSKFPTSLSDDFIRKTQDGTNTTTVRTEVILVANAFSTFGSTEVLENVCRGNYLRISLKTWYTPLYSSVVSFQWNPYFLKWMACELKTIKIHCDYIHIFLELSHKTSCESYVIFKRLLVYTRYHKYIYIRIYVYECTDIWYIQSFTQSKPIYINSFWRFLPFHSTYSNPKLQTSLSTWALPLTGSQVPKPEQLIVGLQYPGIAWPPQLV